MPYRAGGLSFGACGGRSGWRRIGLSRSCVTAGRRAARGRAGCGSHDAGAIRSAPVRHRRLTAARDDPRVGDDRPHTAEHSRRVAPGRHRGTPVGTTGRSDILPRLKSWGSTVTDRAHDGEVPHSRRSVGLWAVPVRPPTRIAGFIYRRAGVHILTRDSVARLTIRAVLVVSAVVGFIPRLKPWVFSLNRCNPRGRRPPHRFDTSSDKTGRCGGSLSRQSHTECGYGVQFGSTASSDRVTGGGSSGLRGSADSGVTGGGAGGPRFNSEQPTAGSDGEVRGGRITASRTGCRSAALLIVPRHPAAEGVRSDPRRRVRGPLRDGSLDSERPHRSSGRANGRHIAPQSTPDPRPAGVRSEAKKPLAGRHRRTHPCIDDRR